MKIENDHASHPLEVSSDRIYSGLTPSFPDEPTWSRLRVIETLDGKGEGLQSRVRIVKDQVVFAFYGHIVTEQSLYTLQVAPGRYVLDPLVMGKVLHSCAPNMRCDMTKLIFIAQRDIAAGEWLTMNYETTEDSLWRSFTCACAVPACRGQIRGRAYTAEPALIRKVGEKGANND